MTLFNKLLRGFTSPGRHIGLIILFLLLIKITFLIYRYHLPLWDESVYIGMGKFLWSFGDKGIWEPIRPIGLPILFGFLWKIGVGMTQVYDLLIFLFVVGNIILLFLITKHLLNEKIALISSIVLSITPVFFFNSLKILTGIPASFFILFSIYLYLKRFSLILVGVVASLSFIIRFPAGIIIIPFFLTILFEGLIKNKGRGKIINYRDIFNNLFQLFSGFILLLPFYLLLNYWSNKETQLTIISSVFNPWISASTHQSNILHQINGTFQNVVYYPWELIMQNPFLIFFVFGFLILIRKKTFFLINISFLFLLFYFTYIINKQIRFSLLFLPFICIYSAYGFFETCKYFYHKKGIRRLFYLSIILFFMLFSLNIIIKGNVESFNFFDKTEPRIVKEYYNLISDLNIVGPILTTDPVFSSYSDELFIPFYNNISDAIKVYRKENKDVKIIIYDHEFYPCRDEECKKSKKELFEDIQSKNHLMYNKTIYDSNKFIFIKE